MSREDLLRKLEERLAEGEISEETYREIKARYDAMPPEPMEPTEAPEASLAEAEPAPEEAPRRPRKAGPVDISALIEETVDTVMKGVSQTLEASLGDEVHEHMDDVSKHIRHALREVGPKFEKGRRRVLIRSVGKVALDEPIEEFRCSGAGKVESDLIAERVRIAGACKIEGRCEGDSFEASGSAKVGKDVKADVFKSSGSTKIQGDLRSDTVTISGMSDVGGDIEADAIRVGGMLRVGGWVRADSFESRGRFRIGEGLEADSIKVVLDDKAEVPIIKGEDILVKRSKRRGGLQAKTIHGDRVSVSGTRARLVRGRVVRIGPQSRIDVVEADKVEVHETALVGERRPLPTEEEEAEEESSTD
ncbi:MAG: SHOCT domain-containing protein [Thermoplasmata archaeon]